MKLIVLDGSFLLVNVEFETLELLTLRIMGTIITIP